MTTATAKKQEIVATDSELLTVIQEKEAVKAEADKAIKMAKALLLQRRQDEIQALLKEKDEPYGKVDIIVGNHKVEVTTPKKVEWSQDELEKIYNQIVKDGANPKVYIKTEYTVSETVFKQWDKETQDYFRDARTVQPGTISLKIATEKGE